MFRRSTVPTALLCCLSTGCATIITGSGAEEKVRVTSEPPGAKVYVNGDYRGATPLSVSVSRKDDHRFRVEYPGYPPRERLVESRFNGWVLGNILLGGIIGLVVDIASGATSTPSPGHIDERFAKEAK